MIDYSNVNWGDAVTTALADLNESKERNKPKTFEKKEVDLTKYFTTNLGKDEKTGQRTFRMLPDQENPLKFAKEVYFHHVQVGKDWKKLYDPSQNGTIPGVESPISEARQALLSHPDKEVKKTAAKFKSKLFYIIRGIERGKEHEGVKFWRFAAVTDGTGAMDKIESLMGIYNAAEPGGGAFWNPIAGRDLIIALGKDEKRGFTKITNMLVSDKKPLHTDQAQMTAWLTDPIKWEDVYAKKGTDFLAIIAEGGVPTWDKTANAGKGGYVAKTDDAAAPTANAQAPAQSAYAPVQEAPKSTFTEADLGESTVLDMDDLPF